MTNKGILELSLLMPFTKWGKGNSPTVDSLVQITRKPFHGGSPREPNTAAGGNDITEHSS